MIDWAGPPASGEQQLVLRNIVALYLRRGTFDKKVNFTHLLIEGKLTHRGVSVYGMFAGNRFFVDMGTHNDMPWYYEVILPATMEYVDIPEDEILFSGLLSNDKYLISEVDISQGRVSDENIL
jgi:hypothetical protein